MPRIHRKNFRRNRKIDHLIDRTLDPCFRCGACFIKTGRVFTLHCVENRVVNFRICRACAQLPAVQVTSASLMQEAA